MTFKKNFLGNLFFDKKELRMKLNKCIVVNIELRDTNKIGCKMRCMKNSF